MGKKTYRLLHYFIRIMILTFEHSPTFHISWAANYRSIPRNTRHRSVECFKNRSLRRYGSHLLLFEDVSHHDGDAEIILGDVVTSWPQRYILQLHLTQIWLLGVAFRAHYLSKTLKTVAQNP